jgi:hypothetical protein
MSQRVGKVVHSFIIGESNGHFQTSVFSIWATSVLKDHLVRGYTLNQRRLAEKGIGEVRQVLSLLSNTLESHELVNDEGRAVFHIIVKRCMRFSIN